MSTGSHASLDHDHLLRVQARNHLRLHVITQMTFQFVQHFGGFDPAGSHSPPPRRDCLFEIKHVVPSVSQIGWRKFSIGGFFQTSEKSDA